MTLSQEQCVSKTGENVSVQEQCVNDTQLGTMFQCKTQLGKCVSKTQGHCVSNTQLGTMCQ